MRSQAHTFLIRVWRHYLPAKIDEVVNPILGKKKKKKRHLARTVALRTH